MIKITRLRSTGTGSAGDAYEFKYACDAALFMLGKRGEDYLITKDGHVFPQTSSDIHEIEKQINHFVDGKSDQPIRPDIPPLGLRPRFIADEQRLNEVRGAIVRYYTEEMKIPVEWIEEYNELAEKVNTLKENRIK